MQHCIDEFGLSARRDGADDWLCRVGGLIGEHVQVIVGRQIGQTNGDAHIWRGHTKPEVVAATVDANVAADDRAIGQCTRRVRIVISLAICLGPGYCRPMQPDEQSKQHEPVDSLTIRHAWCSRVRMCSDCIGVRVLRVGQKRDTLEFKCLIRTGSNGGHRCLCSVGLCSLAACISAASPHCSSSHSPCSASGRSLRLSPPSRRPPRRRPQPQLPRRPRNRRASTRVWAFRLCSATHSPATPCCPAFLSTWLGLRSTPLPQAAAGSHRSRST